MRVAWDLLRSSGGEIRDAGGQLRAGDHPIDGDESLVDRVKALVGGAATVFHGDLRAATNVVKPDGTRAVGTRLAPGPVHDAVLRGRPYRGEADVLGVPYPVAYDPIVAPGGAVVGALFVGVPKAEVFASVEAFERQAVLGGIAVAPLVAGGTLWATRRLFPPLDGLRGAMERLAEDDDIGAIEGAGRPDDLGGMTRAVVKFRRSAVGTSAPGGRRAVGWPPHRAGARPHRGGAGRGRGGAEPHRGARRLRPVAPVRRRPRPPHRRGRPGRIERLRADFNGAMGRLQDTMRSVAARASAIVAQVAEIDGIVGEIASSAGEQATGLDQVNTAVNQMDQVTRQNAAMVEEATAASHALAQETGELARLMGEFRLGGADDAPRRCRPRAGAGRRPGRVRRSKGNRPRRTRVSTHRAGRPPTAPVG